MEEKIVCKTKCKASFLSICFWHRIPRHRSFTIVYNITRQWTRHRLYWSELDYIKVAVSLSTAHLVIGNVVLSSCRMHHDNQCSYKSWHRHIKYTRRRIYLWIQATKHVPVLLKQTWIPRIHSGIWQRHGNNGEVSCNAISLKSSIWMIIISLKSMLLLQVHGRYGYTQHKHTSSIR